MRFKGVGWLRKTVLLELAGYPDGVALDESLTLMIYRMAEWRPEKFQNLEKDVPKQTHVVIIELGILHNECGLVLVEKHHRVNSGSPRQSRPYYCDRYTTTGSWIY